MNYCHLLTYKVIKVLDVGAGMIAMILHWTGGYRELEA